MTPARTTAAEARRMRSAARFYAVQALFQMEAAEAGLEAVLEEFETHRMGAEIEGATYREPDVAHFRGLVEAAVKNQARIDQLTHQALVARWPIDRIDPTLRALFRAAGAELVATDTPPKVTISEYVDVAKAFYPTGREAGFVNGVLDHMARAARPEAFWARSGGRAAGIPRSRRAVRNLRTSVKALIRRLIPLPSIFSQ
jgi:N utilization substance protein B